MRASALIQTTTKPARPLKELWKIILRGNRIYRVGYERYFALSKNININIIIIWSRIIMLEYIVNFLPQKPEVMNSQSGFLCLRKQSCIFNFTNCRNRILLFP